MEQNHIFLSIIIPVYNINSELLIASLKSVISEKDESVEIIVVDDGSTNDAGRICDQFEDKENDVFVYHQNNQGVSVARNNGIEKAHGQYISFVDSDDVVKMDTVLSVARYASKRNIDICFFKYRRDVDFDNNDGDLESAGIIIRDLHELIYNIASQNEPFDGYCIGSPWGKVFRTKYLIHNELRFLPSLRKMQDRVFMMYCVKNEPRIDFVAVEGYCYVRNEESIVNNYNPKIGGYLANVSEEITNFNELHHCLNQVQINTIKCKLLNEYLGLDILHLNNKKTKTEKAEDLRKYVDNVIKRESLCIFNKNEFNINSRIKIFLIKHRCYKVCISLSNIYSFFLRK